MLYRSLQVSSNTNEMDDRKSRYNIEIGNNIWRDILDSFICSNKYHKVIFVVDQIVNDIYIYELNQFMTRLMDQGVFCFAHIIEANESSKDLTHFGDIVNFLMQNEFTRKDLLVSVGGGVIGDLTGFVASTYMRGVDLVHVPTTLLSQLDSSVGGKVAINYKSTKNLVGAFYNPRLVIVDIAFLKTLSARLFVEGLSEGIKTALLKGNISQYTAAWVCDLIELYDSTEKEHDIKFDNFNEALFVLIEEAISYKKEIVQQDPLECGVRVHLNFGHTVGHALEAFGRGVWLHGEAISLGMVLEQLIGEHLEICDLEMNKTLIEILEICRLPHSLTSNKISGSDLMPFMVLDKKNSGDNISLVILVKLGQPRVVKIRKSDFEVMLDWAIKQIEC